VMRGGSWILTNALDIRSVHRGSGEPHLNTIYTYGFRVVRP